jgi:hypothetical protein
VVGAGVGVAVGRPMIGWQRAGRGEVEGRTSAAARSCVRAPGRSGPAEPQRRRGHPSDDQLQRPRGAAVAAEARRRPAAATAPPQTVPANGAAPAAQRALTALRTRACPNLLHSPTRSHGGPLQGVAAQRARAVHGRPPPHLRAVGQRLNARLQVRRHRGGQRRQQRRRIRRGERLRAQRARAERTISRRLWLHCAGS